MTRRLAIQALVAIVVGVFALAIWASGDSVDPGWLRFFGLAALVVAVCWALWDQAIWRIPLVQRLRWVPRDVNGTWRGRLVSQWIDPGTGKAQPPRRAYLVIRQTASTVAVTLFTDESRSRSSLARVSGVDGQGQLDYMYLNKPAVRVEHRSRIHHGSTSLGISGRPATKLEGRYWTDRETRGDLVFPQRRKTHADDLEGAEALFDVTS